MIYRIEESEFLLNSNKELITILSTRVLYESRFRSDIVLKIDEFFNNYKQSKSITNKAQIVLDVCDGRKSVTLVNDFIEIKYSKFSPTFREIDNDDEYYINRMLIIGCYEEGE